MKIAVIGAGLIGTSWAIVFARAGFSVNLTDIDQSRLGAAENHLARIRNLKQNGRSGTVTFCPTLATAVAGVDLVQECGPETVELKRQIFAELDKHAPEGALLASSSSSIVASLFTGDLRGRHRCLIAHPLNPPHLAPLVELCGAPWTSPGVITRAKEIYEDAGQAPIVINEEIEGFVLNRLQAAVLAEALRLVGDGIISAEDLDKTVSEGLGLRWSFLGPFATIELNAPGGIEDYLRRYGGAFQNITATPPSSEVWASANIERVVESWGKKRSAEQLAARSAWRDRRLEALRQHKQSQDNLMKE
ncbi:L-carnitine dehydrogenase [Ensifer psoraleae]|uniref:3-hydroxyacyl-CoA dehydrogenase n=1 Tax=Sinorhizobium psoraleae TaxID=520838 RepID=UPI0015688D5A|nr:3-hydroxyacyl-CoA dehydrogenase [Sinorhizobium psoraleae]NRP72168.1 L-carnitine dehydrogenase [Sinorhizobium psoraleae]